MSTNDLYIQICIYIYIYDYVQEGCLHLPVVVSNACHMHCSPKPQESQTRHVTGFPKEQSLYTENNKSNIGRQQFQEWTHTIPTLFPNKSFAWIKRTKSNKNTKHKNMYNSKHFFCNTCQTGRQHDWQIDQFWAKSNIQKIWKNRKLIC